MLLQRSCCFKHLELGESHISHFLMACKFNIPSQSAKDCPNSLFYAGLARRKSALSLVWLSLMTAAMTTFQWFFWGYTLTFSHNVKSGFLGSLDGFGYMNTLGAPSVMSPKVPDLLMAVYQGMFANLT